MKSAVLLLLLASVILMTSSHHVIFENIGQMAGALSYIHCKLTLNISSIIHQHHAYHQSLVQYRQLITKNYPNWDDARWYYQDRMREWMSNMYQTHLKVIDLHLNETLQINEAILSLKAILPQPASSPTGRVQRRDPDDSDTDTRTPRFLVLPQPSARSSGTSSDSPKDDKTGSSWTPPSLPDVVRGMVKLHDLRAPRFLGFLAPALGAFGTFMGLYNLGQINKLQTELQDVNVRHNRLVEVVEDHDYHLKVINTTIDTLLQGLNIRATHDPALTSTRLSYIELQIKERIQTAVHTIQQAQHRRLAVDFLSHVQLRRLYERLQLQAEENECTLLTQQHSDLFQLEASYFFDGNDVHILLHVPMVPKESLLRLFRLHSFPLPLTKDHSLIPVAQHNVLAISSGFTRYSAQLSHTDLMGCHVVNNIYLCERHGVLNQHLNSTCLGSLYTQDFEAVKRLCPLEVHKAGEIVHQLAGNWFLAYSPKAQTVPITCRNGTSSEQYLAKGINKFNISPGCKAHLQKHLVMSDLSLKLDSDILHFEWHWNDVSLQDLQGDNLLPQLQMMIDSGIHNPTISDLQQLKMDIKRSPGWWAHLVNFTGNLVLFLLFFSLLAFVSYRLYIYRRELQLRSDDSDPDPQIPMAAPRAQ
jgi:hypothetical protein